MERNLYRCGKKLIPVWKETYTGVERNLYRCGKKLIPGWKETYTGVERNLYQGGKELIPGWKETYTGVERNFYRHRFNNRENKRNMNQRERLNIHCDFEQAIIEAINQVYPNSEIKLSL